MNNENSKFNEDHSQTNNTNIFIFQDQETAQIKNWKDKLQSIIEHVPAEADKLTPLIQFIVTAIAPAKIYMMKHASDIITTQKYINLLIVISSKNNQSFVELQPILDMAYLKDWHVSASLHNEGSVIEGLRNGHIFYSQHCIPENLIYDDKITEYPVTSPDIKAEIKFQAFYKFEQYYMKALDFVEGANFLYEMNQSPISGLMIHQAVELTYRGILQGLNGYDKKTHEIRVLRKLTRHCAPLLHNIFSDDSEEEKRILNLLDKAYIGARYEADYQMSESDWKAILKRLGKLLIIAQKVIDSALGIPSDMTKEKVESHFQTNASTIAP